MTVNQYWGNAHSPQAVRCADLVHATRSPAPARALKADRHPALLTWSIQDMHELIIGSAEKQSREYSAYRGRRGWLQQRGGRADQEAVCFVDCTHPPPSSSGEPGTL